ncbi:MAG: DNA polymerase IV, partial [Acidimicrobiales bacterium]
VPVDRSMEIVPAVLHVDMDAFFASVELLDHPELEGKAVIVGGTGRRGVVASCTYEARRFGVRSAMPMFRARELCPNAVYLDGRHGRYSEVSARLLEIFLSVTPLVEPIGLDEAFLDVTGSRRLLGSPVEIAIELRQRVAQELSLRCSVGVGRSKLIAKLASEAAKPKVSRAAVEIGSGVHVVMPAEELTFLHPLAIEALWGVGPATAKRLHDLGVKSVGDIAAVGEAVLVRQLGRSHGEHLAALARGYDPSPVVPGREAKSIGHEQTFSSDIVELDELRAKVVAMSDSVAEVLAREGLSGRTVTLKVRFGDFTTLTRSHTLDIALDAGAAISVVADALLEAVDLVAGVRLLGVSVSALGPRVTTRQLSFALEANEADRAERGSAVQASWEEVAQAVAAIRTRFGKESVGPVSTLDLRAESAEWWGPSLDAERSPGARRP